MAEIGKQLPDLRQLKEGFDGDAAGCVTSETVALSLMSQLFTRVVNLPDGQSPDELDVETLSAFLPYWNLKNSF